MLQLMLLPKGYARVTSLAGIRLFLFTVAEMLDRHTRDMLLEEVATWFAEGLITEDQRDILVRRYRRAEVSDSARPSDTEARASMGLVAVMWVGGALVILGIAFLMGMVWEDIGAFGRAFACSLFFVLAAAAAKKLLMAGSYPKTGNALAIVAGALLWMAVACVVALFLRDTRSYYGADEIFEVSARYGILIFGVLTLAYLAAAVKLRSQGVAWLLALAFVLFVAHIADEFSTGGEKAEVIFFFTVGSTMILVGWLLTRSPLAYMVAPFCAGGMLLSFIAMFVGTFVGGLEWFSFLMLVAIPLGTAAVGVRGLRPGLVYSGLVMLLIALIRIFADVFDDAVGTLIGAIIAGIALIFGAVRIERWRHLRRQAAPEAIAPYVAPPPAG